MTLDEFKTNQESNPCKFHFISAIHSLYYVDDPQMAVDYLYNLLEDGGKLLIVMQDGKYLRNLIHKRCQVGRY